MDGPKPRRGQIDARRISDNAYVYIKVVRTDSAELCLLQFLNREELRDDPMNHCVPLLDVFQDDEDPDLSYMVMPFLHPIMHLPQCEFIADAMAVIDQLLEVRGVC